jgi:glycosyltransferase involved in cell wall biosynthesis
MTCGVPVIISDIPPLREVAGDAAAIFNPKDYEELAGVIGNVLESGSLRSEMIQRGILRAKEYSWQKTAELTIETYKKALKN